MGIERIKDFKRAAGMTNHDIADATGIPKSTIDKILSGHIKRPPHDSMKAIVNALGKTLDDLDDEIVVAENITPYQLKSLPQKDVLNISTEALELFSLYDKLSNEDKQIIRRILESLAYNAP